MQSYFQFQYQFVLFCQKYSSYRYYMSSNNKIESHIEKRFEIIKKIGSGAYGIVWKVLQRKTKKIYALKKNFDVFQNSTDAQRTYRQIMFLKKFNHPNIVELKEVIRSLNQMDIYILFEFMDIDLYTLIRENILGNQHKQFIIYQIAKSIYYLHTAELIHRDIKPSNVLVNQDCKTKLCDFGLIRSIEDQQQPFLTEYIATRWYRAPQILLGSKNYSKAADVWSFGCLLGQIIRGKPMFPGNSTLNQIERVLTWTGPPSLEDLQSLKTDFGKQMVDILSKIKPLPQKDWFSKGSIDAVDLVSKTLNFNPQKRINMLQVLQHPYLRQFYDSNDLISANQKIRISIDDNKKLSLREYRDLIYLEVSEMQKQFLNKVDLQDMAQNIVKKQQNQNKSEQYSKNYQKNKSKKLSRSGSKNKQENLKKKHKQNQNFLGKNKYESLLGKNKNELKQNKYIKTEQLEQKDRLIYPKRKRSDNVGKYFANDKKKKSVTFYDTKKQCDLARYMYEHRKL